jgi:hypothetical protein
MSEAYALCSRLAPEPGSWWVVSGADAQFGPRDKQRRVIVVAVGTVVRAYARTTLPQRSSPSRWLAHPRHGKVHRPPPCRIDLDGYVVVDRTRGINARSLTSDRFSCDEPDSTVVEALRRKRREELRQRRDRRAAVPEPGSR